MTPVTHRTVAAAAVAVLVVGTGVPVGALLVPGAPCHDDLASDAPAVAFAFDRTANGSLVVTHDGGDAITAGNSVSIAVVLSLTERGVTETDSSLTTRRMWAGDGTDGFPIETGDSFIIPKPAVDGRPLQAGDTVQVVWRGHDLPRYCPNGGVHSNALSPPHHLEETSDNASEG